MAKARAVLKLNEGEIRKIVSSPDRPVQRLVLNAQRNVANAAKTNAPWDTGNLSRSTKSEPLKVVGNKVSAEVVSEANYSIYVHEGTTRMRARPYLLNALKSHAPRFGFRVSE